MNTPNLRNIQEAQNEYQALIVRLKILFKNEEITLKKIAIFLDEIKYFWLERKGMIDFELEELTENNSCFLLCGAIYLNVRDYEHYYFKSIGDYHILFDPFLKMENFFRVPEDRINTSETIDYFKNVLSDTIDILDNYKNYFFILPIRELAVEDNDQHHELLEKFFINFISSSFKKEFKNQNDFCTQYRTFEHIESEMEPYVLENLIFNDKRDREMPLRKKLECYCKNQMSFSALTEGQSDAQIILLSVYSWLSQVIDILLICVYLRLNPYIRFDITFHYLALVMYTFIEDQNLKEMIEKTIVFYIFRKIIDVENFKKREFSEYCMAIKNKNILDNLMSKVRKQQIDIFKDGIRKVESIIQDEFSRYFNTV